MFSDSFVVKPHVKAIVQWPVSKAQYFTVFSDNVQSVWLTSFV